MKKILLVLFAACLFSLGTSVASAQAEQKKKAKKAPAAATSDAPTSVMHVITVSWKADTSPDQIKAALDGAHQLTKSYPGITRVWTRTIKAQGDRSHVIAMEFASEKALKDYTDSDAQKEWYKVYLPIRERSTTFDVTN